MHEEQKIIKLKFHPSYTVNIYPLALLKFAWANIEGLFMRLSPWVHISSDFIFWHVTWTRGPRGQCMTHNQEGAFVQWRMDMGTWQSWDGCWPCVWRPNWQALTLLCEPHGWKYIISLGESLRATASCRNKGFQVWTEAAKTTAHKHFLLESSRVIQHVLYYIIYLFI